MAVLCFQLRQRGKGSKASQQRIDPVLTAGHEQVDALDAQQDGAAQAASTTERQQFGPQRRKILERRETVGGDVGDGQRGVGWLRRCGMHV